MEKKSPNRLKRTSDDEREARIILRTLSSIIEPLHATLPGPNEVLLHDLSLLPNSIVKISGSITGRTAGGVATNTLLRDAANNTLETKFNYLTKAADGTEVCSSTLIFRTTSGTPAAAMCMIRDISVWEPVQRAIGTLIPNRELPPTPLSGLAETFSKDVDELAQELLDCTISDIHIPVELMQKRHKISVVADLQQRGFFMLREAAEKAAAALKVSRFTIYNYLKELDSETPDSVREPSAEPKDASRAAEKKEKD